MNRELLLALALLLVFVIWVIAKVIGHARHSEKQWQQVDRGKLRKWDTDED